MNYLQIYWESDDLTQDNKFLGVKLLSIKQFNQLQKE